MSDENPIPEEDIVIPVEIVQVQDDQSVFDEVPSEEQPVSDIEKTVQDSLVEEIPVEEPPVEEPPVEEQTEETIIVITEEPIPAEEEPIAETVLVISEPEEIIAVEYEPVAIEEPVSKSKSQSVASNRSVKTVTSQVSSSQKQSSISQKNSSASVRSKSISQMNASIPIPQLNLESLTTLASLLSQQQLQSGSQNPTPRSQSKSKRTNPALEAVAAVMMAEQQKEEVSSVRNRKVDRRILANDLSSELPITLRYNDAVHIDNHEEVNNYKDEWIKWAEDGLDKLEELLAFLEELEHKYSSSSKRNNQMGKVIQFSLLLLGSGIVYVQASGASAELITKWNIAAGGLTTICTSIYNFFGFAKKAPHFSTVASNLKKLRCWVESKLVLPVDKRFSPFDIYIIATKALQVILEEAAAGKQEGGQ